MTNEKKHAVKTAFKKVGKAIWEALPWVCMVVSLICWFMLPFLYANESGELEVEISALEAENTRYESEQAHLTSEIEWLRSLLEEAGDGQTE